MPSVHRLTRTTAPVQWASNNGLRHNFKFADVYSSSLDIYSYLRVKSITAHVYQIHDPAWAGGILTGWQLMFGAAAPVAYGSPLPTSFTDLVVYENHKLCVLGRGDTATYTYHPTVFPSDGAVASFSVFSDSVWLKNDSSGRSVPHSDCLFFANTAISVARNIETYFTVEFEGYY